MAEKPGPKPKLVNTPATIDQIRRLGIIQATVEETASVLRVSVRTLQNFFAENPDAKIAHEEGKQEGTASLRRVQFQMAEKNASMAIWLGKQYLGQREPVQQIEAGRPGEFAKKTDEEIDSFIENNLREMFDAGKPPEAPPLQLKRIRKVTRTTEH